MAGSNGAATRSTDSRDRRLAVVRVPVFGAAPEPAVPEPIDGNDVVGAARLPEVGDASEPAEPVKPIGGVAVVGSAVVIVCLSFLVPSLSLVSKPSFTSEWFWWFWCCWSALRSSSCNKSTLTSVMCRKTAHVSSSRVSLFARPVVMTWPRRRCAAAARSPWKWRPRCAAAARSSWP